MISPDIIAEMNKEVEEASHCVAGGKRGPYIRAFTGSKVCLPTWSNIIMTFSSKLRKPVSHSTARFTLEKKIAVCNASAERFTTSSATTH